VYVCYVCSWRGGGGDEKDLRLYNSARGRCARSIACGSTGCRRTNPRRISDINLPALLLQCIIIYARFCHADFPLYTHLYTYNGVCKFFISPEPLRRRRTPPGHKTDFSEPAASAFRGPVASYIYIIYSLTYNGRRLNPYIYHHSNIYIAFAPKSASHRRQCVTPYRLLTIIPISHKNIYHYHPLGII